MSARTVLVVMLVAGITLVGTVPTASADACGQLHLDCQEVVERGRETVGLVLCIVHAVVSGEGCI